MHRVLTVSDAADDLALLTIEELREAAGVADAADDDQLELIGLRVAAAITAECNVAAGSGAEPTLLRETLSETFRLAYVDRIVLARRHGVSITSIVEDGATLSATDYLVDEESGILTRLQSDYPCSWCASKVVVVYEAGLETVPGDLKMAAMDFVRLVWRDKDRDPSVKAAETDIPGLMRERVEHWVGAIPGQVGEGPVPDAVAGQLKRYRNAAVCR